MRPPILRRLFDLALGLLAATAIAIALWHLGAAYAGVTITSRAVDGTPVTIFRPGTRERGGERAPVVVIAHGFAGSQQLMQSFALTFARNGYIAVTFDFPGHGRNAKPLTGSITEVDGATQTLVAAMQPMVALARDIGDGRVALLGHSMASDIVVRVAEATPDIAATIAVSMFSPEVTARAPRNLLVIVGEWESQLKLEALRAVGLGIAPRAAEPGVTYGDIGQGTARRAAFSAHVEHASVLFSQDSMREALAWLDQSFGTVRTVPPHLDDRGPWILLLVAAFVLLGWPLSRLLPRLAKPSVGAGRPWRQLWLPLLAPMVVTPLLLRLVPTHFLPILVGDYLAVHFATYGLITALCLVATGVRRQVPPFKPQPVAALNIAAVTAAVILFSFLVLFWPIDSFVTSFVPGPERLVLLLAMLVGTLLFFLSDEWMTRGEGAARFGYFASKVAFLLSLALAVALDLPRLFFLIIIVPVIILFFLIYGLFSAWVYRATGHPLIAGIANALAFAWAIGVTFPLLAG